VEMHKKGCVVFNNFIFTTGN